MKNVAVVILLSVLSLSLWLTESSAGVDDLPGDYHMRPLEPLSEGLSIPGGNLVGEDRVRNPSILPFGGLGQGHRPMVGDHPNPLQGDSLDVRIIGRWAESSSYALTVSGNTIFNGSDGAVHILDSSNPSSIEELSEMPLAGTVENLFYDASILYVALGADGLSIISVADLYEPESLFAGQGPCYDVTASGSYLYVATGNDGMQILDLSNPSSPTVVGSYDTPGFATDLQISGSYIYLLEGTGGGSGIHIINVSDPSSPVGVGFYEMPGITAYNFAFLGSTILLAAGEDGLCLGTDCYDTPGVAYDVVVSGSLIHAADGPGGMRVFSWSDSSLTEVGYYDTQGSAVGIVSFGSYSYLADSDSGLIILEYYGGPSSIGGSEGGDISLPRSFALCQNYPNPFNPSTTIEFDVPGESSSVQSVNLSVYDIRGRRVKTLVDSEYEPGRYRIHWDGRTHSGEKVSSGIYLYRLKAGGQTFTRKMTVLK